VKLPLKNYLSIILFIILYQIQGCAIDKKGKIFTIGLSTGIVGNISMDRHLNYYTYRGISYFPINLKISNQNNKNQLIINLRGSHAQLNPEGLNDIFYEYNYIKQWDALLSVEYLRDIFSIDHKFRFLVGIMYESWVTGQKELYSNLLYNYSKGYRSSFDLSLFSLGSDVAFSCLLNKNKFYCQVNYLLFTMACRPDDNYVKQTEVKIKALKLKPYLPGKYSETQVSLLYQRTLSSQYDLTFQYILRFRGYPPPEEAKFMEKVLLIGISKSF
jgi:hypothetical protein